MLNCELSPMQRYRQRIRTYKEESMIVKFLFWLGKKKKKPKRIFFPDDIITIERRCD